MWFPPVLDIKLPKHVDGRLTSFRAGWHVHQIQRAVPGEALALRSSQSHMLCAEPAPQAHSNVTLGC